ncbi:MAG: DUF3795 domain-containing protein [Solirubrobacterales bacterium]
MDFKEMTSPCGLDCFNCPAQEKNITEEVRQKLVEATGKEPNEVACKGCRTLKGRNLPTIKSCPTYECASEHHLDFCYECEDFPCEKYNPCRSRADKLPHNLKVYNLCKIQKLGLEKWAQESKSSRDRYYLGELIPGVGPVIPKNE